MNSLAIQIIALTIVMLICFLLIRSRLERAAKTVQADLGAWRDEAGRTARESRDELSKGMKVANDTLLATLDQTVALQRTQLDGVTAELKTLVESNQVALDRVRSTVDARVKELQESNEKKLEEMRKTVDEKLQTTLEQRLGESFKLVSERLEAVQKGLGEMQTLATGVGDLKRVLTNVKARGTWAEVQLGALLEEMLSPGQYERNVRVRDGSSESVEYAVRLPGPKNERETSIWLPIDSKFPQEDYVRVQDAAEKGDSDALQKATDALARALRTAAKEVHDKYVNPPATTDFAIVFLATEGLYSEALRQNSLVDDLQRQYRIVLAGPTTLAALLSSLRMGFQTLAIEQRAVEVWRVLAAVKTEFSKFGDVLNKVKKQLNTVGRTIEDTEVRTRVMERRLRSVEELPDEEAKRVLALPVVDEDLESDEAEAGIVGSEEEDDLPF